MQRDDRGQNYNYSLDPIANEHRVYDTKKAAGSKERRPTAVKGKKRAFDPVRKYRMTICAIARVYPRTQAARYRYFSQPAFPADPSPVQSGHNDGVPRQHATERVRP